MKMEATYSFETSVNFCQITQHRAHSCEDLKSHKLAAVLALISTRPAGFRDITLDVSAHSLNGDSIYVPKARCPFRWVARNQASV
jgi:hypothetical protein